MEKVISCPSKVDDVYGLYIDLRKGGFAVRNVGADERGTYVYLEEHEEKDPVPMVESWVGKPAPVPTKELQEARMKEIADLAPPQPPPIPPALEHVSLIRRIFRRIF